ncbi:hypothetical protein FSP39_015958 [Pinctada imbricata]|uniref:Fibronectin type-III domain-containing protein n=1 Tax=Pinctada imbricata TaxID=66713 RepID=A0AA89BXH3_PINIB|nr:hypothetical protein FSP39_015958 [Pinctada imbricata]
MLDPLSFIYRSESYKHYLCENGYSTGRDTDKECFHGGRNIGTAMKYFCPNMAEQAPVKEFYCYNTFDIPKYNWNVPFKHNDRVYFDISATGGGFGDFINREKNSHHKWFLVGKTNFRRYLYRFDLVKPYHCPPSINCSEFLATPDLTENITIDISPPHTGIVHDGVRGTPEVDYQQDKTLHAHWDGFFDRESGVLFYQYGFDTQCIPKAKFQLDVPNSGLNETYSLHAYYTVESEGRYYITVVAYNRALDPSDPVCSDGVTIDTSVPSVKEVKIEGARVKGGLIKNSSSSTYYVVGEDRNRRLISNPTPDCIYKATETEDLDMLPLERLTNGTIVQVDGEIFCSNTSAASSELDSMLSKSSMLYIEWSPVSPPAGIYDYEVGLSSTAGSSSPDVMAFRPTRQHAHIRIMHGDVPDGALFYIIIKTISKANVEGIQTIGPCIIDTTPPDFTGPITVTYSAGYLMASWSISAFLDAQDSYPLGMEFAIGHEQFGTDVNTFQPLRFEGSCSQTSPPTCTSIKINETDWRLHGHHTYYVTVKAENSAGLKTYGISTAYQHDVQLPSEGTVFDVLPGDIDDIDYQTDTTSLSARWSGFEHPHLDVTYKFSVGSTKGSSDVVPETDVGSVTSYTSSSLSLTDFEIYFVTIKAVTDAGYVEVTSDGVTVVEENSVLSGIIINDGEPCTMTVDNSSLFTHHDGDNRKRCKVDIDYQSSTTELKAYWTIPNLMEHYTRNCHFAIEEESIIGAKVTDLILEPGKMYRFKIKFCAILTCYSPLTSNGVRILSNSPTTGQMQIEHRNITQGGGSEKIIINMERFYDPDFVHPVDKYDVIDRYEWAITDQSTTGRTHTIWTEVTGAKLTHSNTWMTFTLNLQKELDTSKCRKFSVRGFNKAKLVSVVSSEILDCDASDPIIVKPNDIIDAVGDPTSEDGYGLPIVLEQNDIWHLADRDYTPYRNYISAVWPRLRYHSYTIAVIHYKSNDITTYYKPASNLDLPDPCSHPDAKACATTNQEFYNFKFDDGILENGERYLVCLHADRTEIQHEKWLQILPEINACSDGVIVDLSPPIGGDVWITNIPGTEYQTSTSDMYVNWESFRDVEELNVLPHSSGIQDYKLGLGTSEGGNDVVAFHSVGVVNHAALHNLNLQSGHTYYATIIGMDFANRTTTKTSSPVIVDTSPPVKSDVAISITGRHIVSKSEIEACWKGLFIDIESGINYYEWSIGSQPGYDDVMNFTKVIDECAENNKTVPLNLHEGHCYYVSVKAHNKAGLMSQATSWAYVVDTTPPVAGHVYDGKPTNPVTRKDDDFQTDMSTLSVYWEGFHDPHTAITEYYISVGTCPLCQDVLGKQAIGIVNEISIDHVHFGPGLIYYSTVTACNTANLCTFVTSDGLIMDNSPPSIGIVFDGTKAHDLEYQSLRTYIGAEWYGFADPQSGLAKYEWMAGSAPGMDDIVPVRETHLAMVGVVTNLDPLLPVGQRIYVTVIAYNHAGLYSQASSNGFVVDVTAPIISHGPEFDPSFGIYNNYLIYRSALKVTWSVSDDESYIERQYISIKSHIGGEFQISSTSVSGIARDFILTGLSLHDGVTYYVQLITCNGAQICSESESSGITVDTTPPLRGMFAIETDHAAELERHIDGWMKWGYDEVNLAWLGFADLHSGIDYYEVSIGKSYMTADLNKNNGVSQIKVHSETGEDKYDEGKVQTFTVETARLTPEIENIFVSVLAVSRAGLRSPVIHSQFEKIPGGALSLVRRCTAITCEGHCVCGAQDKLCQLNGAACSDVTSNNTNSLLSVRDAFPGTFDEDFSASNTALTGSWSISFHQGFAPVWYQWSVGYSSEYGPEGIFDEVLERVWHDANLNHFQIFTTIPGTILTETETYSFFVRAWYTDTTFAIFKSNGVKIKTVPPSSTNTRGSSVNERMLGSTMKDQDHMKHGFPYTIDWKNKFLNSGNSVAHFKVYLSTYPGGHDTFDAADNLPRHVHSLDIKRTYTKAGVKYYSNVVGYGVSGIHHTESSDGFIGDVVKPQAGIVYDGTGLHDIEYQNSSTVVGARWHGFTDTGSGIVSYFWCAGRTTDSTECHIHPLKSVGLHVSFSTTLPVPLSQNTKIYNKVFAVDSVGFRSPVSISDGVTIDLTPPEPTYLYHSGSNLLKNPSFEASDKVTMVDDLCGTNICTLNADYKPKKWSNFGQSCVSTISSDKNLARDGRSFVYIRGSLSQNLNDLEVGKLYRLNFFSSHILIKESIISNKEGFVKLGDKKHIFMLYTKAYRQDGHGSSSRESISWHRHTFYFEATSTSTILSVGSVDTTTGIFLDHLAFEVVEKSQQESNGEYIASHVVSVHEWGSIHGSWAFIEDASKILDYTWAIGYSQGGTQIQGFESVGRSNYAYNSSVVLVHNSIVYITVIASNTAGLQNVAYSNPILVDLTAPVFSGVYDGRLIDEDQDTWTVNEVSVNWKVEDPESGIDFCEWAIGYEPYSNGLQSFQTVPAGSNLMFADFSYSLLTKRTIYTTIRCHNKAGLISSVSTDGVQISNETPNSTNSVVKSIPLSVTEYPAQDFFQSNTNQIKITWTGFTDNIAIKQYKVDIGGSDIQYSETMKFPYGQDVMYTEIRNLQTVPGTKRLSVSAVNDRLIQSDPSLSNATVFVGTPAKDASKQLQVSWNENIKEFRVSWNDIFSSQYPLYYEVSAGRVAGGGEIVQWLETNSTSITFGLPPSMANLAKLDVYLFVRAVSVGGLYDDFHGHVRLP